MPPDEAFANGLAVDVTNTFAPFGQQPQPGSTFYFTSEEVFTKPGATMLLNIAVAPTRSAGAGETELEAPVVAWEYLERTRVGSAHLPERLDSCGTIPGRWCRSLPGTARHGAGRSER